MDLIVGYAVVGLVTSFVFLYESFFGDNPTVKKVKDHYDSICIDADEEPSNIEYSICAIISFLIAWPIMLPQILKF